jgi:hypothetical protein
VLLLQLFAIYTLSIIARQLDGPFGLFLKARLFLHRLPIVGSFFYQLLECPYRIGFHCGYIVYLLSGGPFSVGWFVLWGLAGSTLVRLGDWVFSIQNE